MSTDEWRVVPDFPNYLVSRRGEVRGLVRGRLLTPVPGPRGYLRLSLYKDGRPTNFLIHRLVVIAHLGPIPAGREVNHKDGDKCNNSLDNLEVVTAEENRRHAANTGLLRVGEENPMSRLTAAQVRTIRTQRAAGVRVRDLAYRYDVSERTVYSLCRKKTWRHIL